MTTPTQLVLFLLIVALMRWIQRTFSPIARALLCLCFYIWFFLIRSHNHTNEGQYFLSFCTVIGLMSIFQIEDWLVVWKKHRAEKKLKVPTPVVA